MFDTWTVANSEPYLSVTGHYTVFLPERPQEWSLQTDQLMFTPFKGHHSGSNMAKLLMEAIDAYGIWYKVSVVRSMASTFHSTIFRLGGWHLTTCQITTCVWGGPQKKLIQINSAGTLFSIGSGKSLILFDGIWCWHMSHCTNKVHGARYSRCRWSFHQGYQACVILNGHTKGEGKCCGSRWWWRRWAQQRHRLWCQWHGWECTHVGDTSEFLSYLLSAWADWLYLCWKIRKSPQAHAFFCQACEQVHLHALELKLWVCTRWASLYDFLDRMITLCLVRTRNFEGFKCYWVHHCQAVNQFTRDADDSPDIPKLVGKCYADFRLTASNWEKLELMHEVLCVHHNLLSFILCQTDWLTSCVHKLGNGQCTSIFFVISRPHSLVCNPCPDIITRCLDCHGSPPQVC